MINVLLPANASERNRHHTHSHIFRNLAEFYDETLGRGRGDPDAYGYPGMPDDAYVAILDRQNDSGVANLTIDLSDVPYNKVKRNESIR